MCRVLWACPMCIVRCRSGGPKFTTDNSHHPILRDMNAKELLQCAPRLSESNRAYIIINNGERGIIVPPGEDRTLICLRLVDARGHPIGPVKTELRLEELPAPPAPLRLAPWCVNCGSAATLRCSACGSSICGVPCATERWKQHRPECRRLQAVAFGEEYARKEDRSYRMINACLLYTSPSPRD